MPDDVRVAGGVSRDSDWRVGQRLLLFLELERFVNCLFKGDYICQCHGRGLKIVSRTTVWWPEVFGVTSLWPDRSLILCTYMYPAVWTMSSERLTLK